MRRLSTKLILSLTVIVIIINLVAGYAYLLAQRRHVLDTIIVGADQLSNSITSSIWHAMRDDRRDAAYATMSVIAEKKGVDHIRMFNREGWVTHSTQPGEPVKKYSTSDSPCSSCHATLPVKTSAALRSRSTISTSADGSRILSMATPIYNEPACSQAACHAHPANLKVLGVLEVGLRLDALQQEEDSMTAYLVIRTTTTIVLTAIFIIFFVRRFVTVPIGELITGTEHVSEMALDRPISIRHGSVEMDALVHSFNVMRERLQGAMGEINEFTQSLERKVAERTQQLKSAQQKLLHADRLASLGQLAASVAHEINNPISGVLNLSMLMQRILKDDGIPPERLGDFRRYLGQVSNETTRVGRIVSDLLAFSRRSKPQRTSADLNKIIRTTVTLASHKLKLSEAKAELRLAEDLPLVNCDASQIQQVVLNLVMNAGEAIQAKGGGTVRITTRMAPEGGAVELIVADNGEGIPPQNLEKIFDPFFTSKPEGKGVGLGLAVLYGIVKAHDGEVDVESEPGHGATFTVTLPLNTEAKPPEAAG